MLDNVMKAINARIVYISHILRKHGPIYCVNTYYNNRSYTNYFIMVREIEEWRKDALNVMKTKNA